MDVIQSKRVKVKHHGGGDYNQISPHADNGMYCSKLNIIGFCIYKIFLI